MSAVVERVAREVTWTAREIVARVPSDAAQLSVVRHVGELLLSADPYRPGEELGHPRADDVLLVTSEYVNNGVVHGDQRPGAQIYVRFAVSDTGLVEVSVCNEVGQEPPGFVRLPEDAAELGPVNPLSESGRGLSLMVPGLADWWSVEVAASTVVARAGFGLAGGAS